MARDPVLIRRTQREAVAYLVADHWRTTMLTAPEADIPRRLMAHPLALVQAALNGETDPAQLGVDPESPTADLIREACRGA